MDLNGSKWLQMAWNGFSSALKVLHYSKKEMPKGAKKVQISFFLFLRARCERKNAHKKIKKNKRNKLIKGFQVWLQMAPNASK